MRTLVISDLHLGVRNGADVLARPPALDVLPAILAPLAPGDVWAADRPGQLSPVVRGYRDLVYVPNSGSNTVAVVDNVTRAVAELRGQLPPGYSVDAVIAAHEIRPRIIASIEDASTP